MPPAPRRLCRGKGSIEIRASGVFGASVVCDASTSGAFDCFLRFRPLLVSPSATAAFDRYRPSGASSCFGLYRPTYQDCYRGTSPPLQSCGRRERLQLPNPPVSCTGPREPVPSDRPDRPISKQGARARPPLSHTSSSELV